MKRVRRVIIIGGGIGGLAAATALRQAGVEAEIYEQAPELHARGAGLWLWANALHALETLGLSEGVRVMGVPGTRSQIRSWRGTLLVDLVASHVAIHRADLQAVLLAAVDPASIHLDMHCTGVTQDSAGVTAHFGSGRSIRGDVLIGADGIHSVVRAQLAGERRARPAGFTAWRAVIPVGQTRFTPGASWGRGARFGFIPLRGDRVNWFAALNQSPERPDAPDGGKADLLKQFHTWHAPIADVIEATDGQSILRNDIYDRPPSQRWSRGRVTLLGDAAHPMTPSLGQGACQAIEDAVVLARCLCGSADPQAALRQYEQQRRPRTRAVARSSRYMDRLVQIDHPALCALRDALVRHAPARLRAHQLRWILDYHV